MWFHMGILDGVVKTLFLLRCCIFYINYDVPWYAEIKQKIHFSHLKVFT